MRTHPLPLVGLEVGVRWTARVFSALLVGLVFIMFFGLTVERGFHPLRIAGVEPIQMVCFWIACLGMVVALRWQALGGGISLAGMVLFFAVEFAVRGGMPRGLLVYLMLVPGILFLVGAAVEHGMHTARRSDHGPI
jgi:hypothetical protein